MTYIKINKPAKRQCPRLRYLKWRIQMIDFWENNQLLMRKLSFSLSLSLHHVPAYGINLAMSA